MWPFKKKKKKEEPKKSRNAFVSKSEEFDIGRTKISITFKDKRKFDVWVYGEFTQNIWRGDKLYESYAHAPTINSSKVCAQSYLASFSTGHSSNFIDDNRNISKSAIGEPFNVLYLEEEKDESQN